MLPVPYRLRPGDPPGTDKKPWLILWVGTLHLPEWAMIDSGSTHSLLPPHIATQLGLQFDPAFPLTGRGVTGGFRYSASADTVDVMSEVGAITLDHPVVSPYPGFTLLGQRDFFAGWQVTFNQRAGFVYLEKLSEPLGFRKRN